MDLQIDVLDLTAEQLAEVPPPFQKWSKAAVTRGGRVELWEPPREAHEYAIGVDFAKGMEGRDYDAAVILDTSVKPVRQVFEMHGHWGPDLFDKLLFCAHVHYNEGFIFGEAQEGLAVLRRLYDVYGATWMYYDRSEEKRGRALKDKLGYWKTGYDVTIPNLRTVVREQRIILRSRTLIDQMGKTQYAPGSRFANKPEEALDEHLEIRLAGGGSPDLVVAAAYAWSATREMGGFEKPPSRYDRGTYGHMLEHAEHFDEPEEDQDEGGRRRRRR